MAPRVVLGVCGGIAAYKAVEICRQLVDAGLHVAPVMTADATRFVGEVTFSALASEPVQRTLWDEASPIPHTRLGQTADLVLVAPATADFLARYAAGMANDLLTATLLATTAPVVVCPAMHTEMWEHPAVQENLATLARRGVTVIPPDDGHLAGGDSGPGRLADPSAIVASVLGRLGSTANATTTAAAATTTTTTTTTTTAATAAAAATPSNDDLAGRTVLVSAGGTREPLDPVRFISNRSSGKQGHALAEAAARRGAKVILVTASPLPSVSPAHEHLADAQIERIDVDSAAQMEAALTKNAGRADVIVMAAAVADFRPKKPAPTKLTKDDGVPEIVLEQTPDILAGLAAARRPGQIVVGFAAETTDPVTRGRRKLERKKVDLLVVNDVTAPGAGFDHDTNIVTILDADGGAEQYPLTTKKEVADAIFDRVIARFATERNKASQ